MTRKCNLRFLPAHSNVKLRVNLATPAEQPRLEQWTEGFASCCMGAI